MGKIENKEKIVIEKEGGNDLTYADFRKEMPEDEPRYAVVDVAFETDDGRPQDKIVFILSNPDTCAVKPKMLYASSKDSIRKKLEGVAKEIQANDRSDMEYEEVL